MTEDGFPDDCLTLLVLQDATLFGNSEELKAYDNVLVDQTRDRLIRERYVIVSPTGPRHPRTNERRMKSKLTSKGIELFQRLKGKVKDC